LQSVAVNCTRSCALDSHTVSLFVPFLFVYSGGFRAWREGQRRLLEHATAPALQAVDAALLAELPGLSALPSLPSRALAAAMGAGLDAVTLPPLWTGALAPVVQAVRAVHERGLEEFEDDGSPLLPHCVPTVEDAALALTRLQQLKQEIIEVRTRTNGCVFTLVYCNNP
jgi:hypothetical protein